VREFLQAIARHRKVDVTWAGQGFVRLSLGGRLEGDEQGYQRFGRAVEAYLCLLKRYWERFEASGRDLGKLDALFVNGAEDPLGPLFDDLEPLLALQPASKRAMAMPIAESERGSSTASRRAARSRTRSSSSGPGAPRSSSCCAAGPSGWRTGGS